MRQCPRCNRVYEAEIAYCLEDGSLLNSVRETAAPSLSLDHLTHLDVPTIPSQRKKNYTPLWLALGAIAIAVAAIIVWQLSQNNDSHSVETGSASTPEGQSTPAPAGSSTPGRTPRATPAITPSPSLTPSPTLTPTPQAPQRSIQIGVEFIELEPEETKWYGFSVPSNSARVTGFFAAQGGISSDVYVWIIPKSDLAAFRNGQSFKSYYQSGKVNSDSINQILPAGEYYLVLKSPTRWTQRHIRCHLALESI